MDSNFFVNERLGKSDTDDDSYKRSEGKFGIWFGPRLGRSLQRHPILDSDRWNSIDGMIFEIFPIFIKALMQFIGHYG